MEGFEGVSQGFAMEGFGGVASIPSIGGLKIGATMAGFSLLNVEVILISEFVNPEIRI